MIRLNMDSQINRVTAPSRNRSKFISYAAITSTTDWLVAHARGVVSTALVIADLPPYDLPTVCRNRCGSMVKGCANSQVE